MLYWPNSFYPAGQPHSTAAPRSGHNIPPKASGQVFGEGLESRKMQILRQKESLPVLSMPKIWLFAFRILHRDVESDQ